MKILLAATAASAALALAAGASAQTQYGSQGQPGDQSQYGPPGGYDQGYDDQSDGGQDMDDQDPGAYPPPGYGGAPPAYPSRSYGPPAAAHYPTNGYQRVPDAGQQPGMAPPPYGQDMEPGDDESGDYGAQGGAYPTDRDGYPGDWNSHQAGPAPAPRGAYGPRANQNGGPPDGANYAPAVAAPADLIEREQRLEGRIRRMDERGAAPNYATDNLMIVLNSIRDQQDELARRDNGLNFTDRRFIEERLDRLEEQVRALR